MTDVRFHPRPFLLAADVCMLSPDLRALWAKAVSYPGERGLGPAPVWGWLEARPRTALRTSGFVASPRLLDSTGILDPQSTYF